MNRPPTGGPAAQPLSFDLELLIRLGAGEIAKGIDFPSYQAMMTRLAPNLFIGVAEDAAETEHGRRVVHILGRTVWSHCPNPGYGFAPGPLPAVELKGACHCGSGRKYQQCCLLLEGNMPGIDINWLEHFILHLPKTRWKDMAGSQIPLDMVVRLAAGWLGKANHKDIVALLEPWFVDDNHLSLRFEPLQDLLLEAYTALRKTGRKTELIERAIARGDGASRSNALQKRATMLADEGDFDQAWNLFREAQRAAPDDPSLAHLEVILLTSSGRDAEARERARFWIARITRRKDPGLDGLLNILRMVANEGGAGMVTLAEQHDPQLAMYRRLWAAAPAIESLYELKAMGSSAGPLKPLPLLAQALAEWTAAFPAQDYSPLRMQNVDLWESAGQWLPVLERHACLWNAFEVLDALVQAVLQLAIPDVGAQLGIPLLERAEPLLHEVLRSNQAEGLRLEWGWMENRPALTLIGQLAASFEGDEPDDRSLARMQWLVDTLNPDDNQGMRMELMRTYVLRGRFDEAIALSDRHPDDFAAMRYDRALAQHGAGRVEDAVATLREAAAMYPHVLKYLLAADPKPVKSSGHGVRIGGTEEAWQYRQNHLAIWERQGALEWARSATGRRGRGKPGLAKPSA